MRVELKNKKLLHKLQQPLPIFLTQLAKKWKLQTKSAYSPTITLTTRKKPENIEDRSLDKVKFGVWIGGKQGTDYNYQKLHEIIREELEGWEVLEFDGKVIKVKAKPKADESE